MAKIAALCDYTVKALFYKYAYLLTHLLASSIYSRANP